MDFKKLKKEDLIYNEGLIQETIKKFGFSFEGKKFPYSIQPLVILENEYEYFLKSTEKLSECLEIALKAHKEDEYIQQFFSYYSKYKKLFEIEQPGRNIVISRFDVVWNGGTDYKVFECNTCCPGGISILGTIKREYIKLPIIKEFLNNKKYTPFICDYTENFINALVQQYKISTDYTPLKIGIAFANHNGYYTYELNEFAEIAKKMGFNAVVCDLKDLTFNNEILRYNEIEINIVYNKVDQLMLSDSLLAPIIEAIKKQKAISVNPYSAMFITESKMILALLQDKVFQDKYLTIEQKEVIDKHIPWTRKVEEKITTYKNKEISLIPFLITNKDLFVLKVDNETRGSNIYIGKDLNKNEWEFLLKEKIGKNWIVQEYCSIPKIEVPVIEKNEIIFEDRYYGIDFFMFNGKFSGIVSRISEKKIINVGSGGFEQPVLVIEK